MENRSRAVCPHCGTDGGSENVGPGQDVQCRRCGQAFRAGQARPVPGLEEVLASSDDIDLAPESPEEVAQEARVRAKWVAQMRDDEKKLHEA